MHEVIAETLKQLETEQEFRILFAAESGSRAWGFASPDSDYDVRVIYAKPFEWYLGLEEKPRDTFDVMLPGDLDVSGWELRKTLRLFGGCNLALYEWLGSPILYRDGGEFADRLKALIPYYFHPVRAVHHYLAMKANALENLDSAGMISIKKLFYALRGLAAAIWSAELRSMPPTEFQKLLESGLLPQDILDIAAALQEEKKNAAEKARVMLPSRLAQYFRQEEVRLQEKAGRLAVSRYGREELESLFRETIRST